MFLDSGTCTSCPADTYQDTAAFTGTACSPCPGGSSTMGLTGSGSAQDCICEIGYYGAFGGPCTACGQDTYAQYIGQLHCDPCPDDSSTMGVEGSTLLSSCKCNAGYAGDLAVDSSCAACADGFAKSESGPEACYLCADRDAHSTSIGITASVACACVQGYVWDGTVCVACPTAYFKDSTGNVSSCYAIDPTEECCQCSLHKTTLDTASDAAEDCLCIAGFEAASSTDECTPCPVGQYKAGLGSAACDSCPTGGTTTNLSSTDASACVAQPGYYLGPNWLGFVGNEGLIATTYDLAYADPSYASAQSVEECMAACVSSSDCVIIHFYCYGTPPSCICDLHLNEWGAGMKWTYDPSYWWIQHGYAFVACPLGTYQPDVGGTSCSDCPTGAMSGLGSTAETSCLCDPALGYVARKPDRTDLSYCVCAPGYYEVGDGTCALCAVGGYCPGSDTGYTTSNGADGVTYDGGQYVCPLNAHTLTEGATSSTDCECDAGYTETTPGAARRLLTVTCIQCNVGHYKDAAGNGACTACPDHSISPAGSTSLASCQCIAGYTGPDGGTCAVCPVATYKEGQGSGACEPCPANTSSPSGSQSLLDCACNLGYSSSDGSPSTCSACGPNTYKDNTDLTSCSSCPAFSSSPHASVSITACLCNPGYTGPSGGPCLPCAVGTFKSAPGSALCLQCHANSSSPAGTSMQYELVPQALNKACSSTYQTELCPCLTSSAPTTGTTCTQVTDMLSDVASLQIEGIELWVALDLGHSQALSHIQLKVATTGDWKIKVASNAAELPGQVCKAYYMHLAEVTVTIDVTGCVGQYVSVEYTQSDATFLVLHQFVVYGAPPPSCTCNPGHFQQEQQGVLTCAACAANYYKEEQGNKACSPCPVAAQSPEASALLTTCLCPPGYSGDAAAGFPCESCSVNTYKAGLGPSPCEPCARNSSASVASAAVTDCVCDAGFTGPAGGACAPCLSGTYSQFGGEAECTACPLFSSSPAGSQDLLSCRCNAGYTGLDGQECTICASGTYKSDLGSSGCQSCPANSISPAGSDQLTDCLCDFGFTGPNGGTCTACDANTYKDSIGTAPCTDCYADASAPVASIDATACECNAGYSGGHGTECHACSPNSYELNTTHACVACPLHSSSPSTSSTVTDCTCNAGYSGPNGGDCQPCPSNTFKNASGSASCTNCPDWSTSLSASTTASDCACDPEYIEAGDGSCDKECAAGNHMSSDGASCEPCPNNFYKEAFGAQECTRCPEHAIHGLTEQTSINACYCEQGYLWDSATKTCQICPTGSFNNRANESQCFDCVSSGAQAAGNDNSLIPSSQFSIRCVCECTTTYPVGTQVSVTQDYRHITLSSEAVQFNYDFNRAWYDFALIPYTISHPIFNGETYLVKSRPSTSSFLSAIRFRVQGPSVTSSGIASTILVHGWMQYASFFDVRVKYYSFMPDFAEYNIGHSMGQIKIYKPWNIWITAIVQIYDNTVYIKYQCEGESAVVVSYSYVRLNTATTMQLNLGSYNQRAGFEISHLVFDLFHSNSNAYNELEFVSQCAGPPVTDHTQCPGLSQVPAGYQATSSGANMEPCPVNHYNDGSQLQCTQCPTGTYSPQRGLTSVGDCLCQAGYTRVNGACTACELGKYKSETGDAPCSACWAHSTTLQPGNSAPDDCKCMPNYGTSTECKICRGHYGPGGDSVDLLDPNLVWGCTNGCDCRVLADGVSLEELMASECSVCVPCTHGTFKHHTDNLACLPCPSNSTLPSTLPFAPTSCQCDPGFTGNAGQGVGEQATWHEQQLCAACAVGNFKDSFGASPCISCGSHTETAEEASTSQAQCACQESYEDGPQGGPHVAGGECVLSCSEGQTGSAGVCQSCATGKFKGARGGGACSECPPPRTASRKGAKKQSACSCARGQMGLDPTKYVTIESVGVLSEQGVVSTTLDASQHVFIPASSTHRLKALQVQQVVDCALTVRLNGRLFFACEPSECKSTFTIDLLGTAGSLAVLVTPIPSGGPPTMQLMRYTRRTITLTSTTQTMLWWNQAQAEELALQRNLKSGDMIYSSQTPFSTDFCTPCPRTFRCKDFI